ncbi:hypothetical protein P3342_001667 [Pyrenophora teres f. teres]|nr:hypothetical protein P3342_001667 [Pyrenophora teres f. teres]
MVHEDRCVSRFPQDKDQRWRRMEDSLPYPVWIVRVASHPFGMANAPSTFQRCINWTLREYIDDFCSAYLDDVLIYTNGTLKEHQQNTNKVLEAMGKAGLPLDIKKCEFDVKCTKYLGFVIEAGKGLKMDPDKVKAIKEWEPPVNVKGVRSFLGFANFYRRFIKNYSEIAAPLTRLTGNVTFRWGEAEQQAFDKLKGPLLLNQCSLNGTLIERPS